MNPNKGKGRAVQFLRDLVGHDGDDCIKWPFTRDGGVGRGRVGYNGVSWWAHRLMCTFAHGEQPEGKPHVAHSCGKGHEGCVNPKHLSWSTPSSNALDRAVHGTNHRRPRKRKLTREQVEQIRAQKGIKTQMALAAEYGVSDNAIRNIYAGRTWKEVDRSRGLTDDQVREIRRLAGTMTKAELARRFDISQGSIAKVIEGRSYKEVA